MFCRVILRYDIDLSVCINNNDLALLKCYWQAIHKWQWFCINNTQGGLNPLLLPFVQKKYQAMNIIIDNLFLKLAYNHAKKKSFTITNPIPPNKKTKQKTNAKLPLLKPLREQNAPQLLLFLYHFSIFLKQLRTFVKVRDITLQRESTFWGLCFFSIQIKVTHTVHTMTIALS